MKKTFEERAREQDLKMKAVCEKKMARALKKGKEEKAQKIYDAFLEYTYGPNYTELTTKTFFKYDEEAGSVTIYNVGMVVEDDQKAGEIE